MKLWTEFGTNSRNKNIGAPFWASNIIVYWYECIWRGNLSSQRQPNSISGPTFSCFIIHILDTYIKKSCLNGKLFHNKHWWWNTLGPTERISTLISCRVLNWTCQDFFAQKPEKSGTPASASASGVSGHPGPSSSPGSEHFSTPAPASGPAVDIFRIPASTRWNFPFPRSDPPGQLMVSTE